MCGTPVTIEVYHVEKDLILLYFQLVFVVVHSLAVILCVLDGIEEE